MKTTDALLVGVDFTNGKDHGVLIVGRKNKGELVDVVNAFQDEEAKRIYDILTTKTILEVNDGRRKEEAGMEKTDNCI